MCRALYVDDNEELIKLCLGVRVVDLHVRIGDRLHLRSGLVSLPIELLAATYCAHCVPALCLSRT